MTILALLLLVAPIALGCALLLRWNIVRDQITLVLIGAIAGPVVFFTALYALTWIVAPSRLLLWSAVAVVCAVVAWLVLPLKSAWRQLQKRRPHLIIAVLMALLAVLLAPNLLHQNEDGISTSILHAWGDLGWHMANISMFEVGQSFPPQNPILAGERLTYPFLTNFISGMLRVAGASYGASVTIPAFIWLTVGLSLVYLFSKALTRSHLAAAITLLLLIGSGSTLGWNYVIAAWQSSDITILELLLHLPNNLSGNSGDANGYHFVNIILAGLLPQRSFLLGLPLAMALLLTLLLGLKHRREAHFIAAGIMAGVMPLTHAHSVVALVPVILLLLANSIAHSSKGDRKALVHLWTVWFLTAVAVGLPQVLYFALNQADGSSFIRWEPGWNIQDRELLSYWFGNTGFMIPLAVLALALPWLTRRTQIHPPRYVWLVGVAGAILLLAANLFSFAPWVWDNYKLLVYWFVFTIPILGWLGAKIIHQRHVATTALVVMVIAFQVVTGILDVTRVALPTTRSWGEWDQSTVGFAQSIKKLTETDAVIVTAPYHNNPVALTGRPLYLGFPGHVWTHGHDYTTREQGVRNFYEGRIATLPEIDVAYVVVGPVERQQFPQLKINEAWTLIAEVGPHQLYSIRPTPNASFQTIVEE